MSAVAAAIATAGMYAAGGAIAGGLINAGGAYLAGQGTADAQTQQNKAAAQAAAQQSAQAWYNELARQGINVNTLIQQFPDLQQTYQEALARGDKRDFQTWLWAAMRAAPDHPLWDAIANPGVAGSTNTTLPASAVDANGNPIQPVLIQAGIAQGTGQNNPATAPIANLATPANIAALFAANPSIRDEIVANMAGGDDTRTPEQWLAAHITQSEQGAGTFSTLLRNFSVAQATGGNTNVVGTPSPGGGVTPAPTTPPTSTLPGAAGTGNNTTLDPAIAALIPGATTTLANLQNGTFLTQQQDEQAKINAARDAGAAAALARIVEQRGLSGDLLNTELGGIQGVLDARTAGAGGIFDASVGAAGGVRTAAEAAARQVNDANVTKLAALLGVRRDAAQAIYDASATGAGAVRDARTTGAKGIYDAERLQADTYAQSAEQALSRVLAQQGSERARRGFTGGSSGSDILSARTMAGAIQQGAGVRAQAGVNYQGRLSDAGIGYAGDMRTAGVGRANTLGLAAEADAQAQLQAAVELARSLGLAGTNYATSVGQAGIGRATSLAGAGEQNAIAILQAKVADATRRLSYLTADADIAKAQADLANAQDGLRLIANNQQQQIGAIGTPYSLAGMDLSLKGNLSAQQYTDLQALNNYLNNFKIAPAAGTTLTTTVPGAVANGTQIAGTTLQGIGSAIGNTASNQSLADLLNSLGYGAPGSGGGAGASATPNPVTGSILGSSNFLAGASVFGGGGGG